MGKGVLFGLVFTFTCPILVFSVIEIIIKRNLRMLLNISICLFLITIFAFTVPTQQIELSSSNTNKQTTTEKNNDTEKTKNNPNENIFAEYQVNETSDDTKNSKPKNKRKIINRASKTVNDKNTAQQTTTENTNDAENTKNIQNEKVFIEPSDKIIDSEGFIYNVNKTFSIGMTEITAKRFILRTSWGLYIVTMEYQINNNDTSPIVWKFSGTNKGNMIGTIVTNNREKIWMGKASNYTDKYIDQHIESGTLQAKSEFNAAVNFAFDTQYEDPELKENEMMNFTIYYSQNNIDSELSIILNEK